MNLWIDAKTGASGGWNYRWTWVINPATAISVIKRNAETDPVTLINVDASLAETFLELLNQEGGTYEVVLHGGNPTARTSQLISQNKWDKKVMDARTAEVIMILKGNHNLEDGIPDDTPNLGTYLQDIALYLSDDCACPFSHYANNPGCLTSVIQNVVTDYMKACYNPSFLVWEYFQTKRQWGDRYDDNQCWCVALMSTAVRDNGKFINGWNEHNTQPYARQRKFIP